jgi:hypothetical protein
MDTKKYAGKLVYRFESCIFSTKEFPSGSFEQNDMVRTVFAPVRVETIFYNEKFEEVKEDAIDLFEKGKDKVEASKKEAKSEMN